MLPNICPWTSSAMNQMLRRRSSYHKALMYDIFKQSEVIRQTMAGYCASAIEKCLD